MGATKSNELMNKGDVIDPWGIKPLAGHAPGMETCIPDCKIAWKSPQKRE